VATEVCIVAVREARIRQIVLQARKYHENNKDVVLACDHVLHMRVDD
jgi:hypothetical protein